MNQNAKRVFKIGFLIFLLLSSSLVFAEEKPKDDQTHEAKQYESEPVPDLADLIPKTTKLSRDLANLENKVAGILDISKFDDKYARIEDDLKNPTAQLEQTKASKNVKLDKLLEIKIEIEQASDLLTEINKPIGETIRQFSKWRNSWYAEKQQWSKWESALVKYGDLDQIKSIFTTAAYTHAKALGIVKSHQSSILTAQERASDIQEKIIAIDSAFDS